ncbi:MAG: hypothetical protein KJ970_11780 [Candidatus Eisenbacteria bacterium]|uniref:DAGKc domain-containing protein n=1 Tax=Eiseniibacteriota bacterium TaxID=2212470 RepID=A0A948WD77_UNCEI|nr:hypothetical protein [Candidatus Eisenbacteria bacterium]MBU1950926.1 hypothetical protein [Candidatus Eisenbacteria bacterium]MBU2691598.1 hypothetical protein [Candidatus Eisenbacteria bacterium]
MKTERIDIIATTISGSIQDWKKVERIVPLFRDQGFDNVQLHEVDTHKAAREKTSQILTEGGRIPISAGGSGTFRNVLEGCIDSGIALSEIRLGFLRKGSADLIGKVLDMPDKIEEAVRVFAESIERRSTLPCDVLLAESVEGNVTSIHFVGYGGAEIFGRIPYYTENRYIKWYKGILSQFFGDLGPFTTGMILSLGERLSKGPFGGQGRWKIHVDGHDVAEDRYQALIILNGYLGPELSFTSDPLGSGHFHLFAMRDIGIRKLPQQATRARSGKIMEDPEAWGMQSYLIRNCLELSPSKPKPFPANIDGSTMICHRGLRVRIVDRVPLISRSGS